MQIRGMQGDKVAEVQYLTTLPATVTLIALFEKSYGTIGEANCSFFNC